MEISSFSNIHSINLSLLFTSHLTLFFLIFRDFYKFVFVDKYLYDPNFKYIGQNLLAQCVAENVFLFTQQNNTNKYILWRF